MHSRRVRVPTTTGRGGDAVTDVPGRGSNLPPPTGSSGGNDRRGRCDARLTLCKRDRAVLHFHFHSGRIASLPLHRLQCGRGRQVLIPTRSSPLIHVQPAVATRPLSTVRSDDSSNAFDHRIRQTRRNRHLRGVSRVSGRGQPRPGMTDIDVGRERLLVFPTGNVRIFSHYFGRQALFTELSPSYDD